MIGGDVLAESVASISRRRGQPEGSSGDGSSMSSSVGAVARCDDSTGRGEGKRWIESGELAGWLDSLWP
jgi:hypothetical protein